MCRRTEEVCIRPGSQRHRHFVGFFNVPVFASYDTLGIRGTHSRLLFVEYQSSCRASCRSDTCHVCLDGCRGCWLCRCLLMHQIYLVHYFHNPALPMVPLSGEVNWLFNVTINDISVIYVTAHRCAGGLKKLDLRSGSQRHRHFVGFFNVPVLAPTRDQPFYTVIPTHRPI